MMIANRRYRFEMGGGQGWITSFAVVKGRLCYDEVSSPACIEALRRYTPAPCELAFLRASRSRRPEQDADWSLKL